MEPYEPFGWIKREGWDIDNLSRGPGVVQPDPTAQQGITGPGSGDISTDKNALMQALQASIYGGGGGKKYEPPTQQEMTRSPIIDRSRDLLDTLGVKEGDRMGALDALRGISEGLGNIRPVTTGDVMFKTKPRDPFVDETNRRLMADQMDFMTPEESLFYNSALQTKQFYPGLRKSSAAKIFPELGALMRVREQQSGDLSRNRDLLAYGNLMERMAEGERSQERIDVSKQRETRLAGQFDKMVQYKDRLPPKVFEDVRMLRSTTSTLDRFENWFNISLEKDPNAFGPIWGRVNQLIAKWGTADPAWTRAQAELTEALGTYLTTKTGAQRGMQEVAWLATRFPQVFQNAENMQALLEDLRQAINDEVDNYYITYAGEFRTTPIDKMKSDLEAKTSPPSTATTSTQPSQPTHSAPTQTGGTSFVENADGSWTVTYKGKQFTATFDQVQQMQQAMKGAK